MFGKVSKVTLFTLLFAPSLLSKVSHFAFARAQQVYSVGEFFRFFRCWREGTTSRRKATPRRASKNHACCSKSLLRGRRDHVHRALVVLAGLLCVPSSMPAAVVWRRALLLTSIAFFARSLRDHTHTDTHPNPKHTNNTGASERAHARTAMDSVEESGFPYSLPTSGTGGGGHSVAAAATAATAAPTAGATEAAAAATTAAAAAAPPVASSSQEGEGQAGPTPAKQQQQHFEALMQNVPLSASLTASGACGVTCVCVSLRPPWIVIIIDSSIDPLSGVSHPFKYRSTPFVECHRHPGPPRRGPRKRACCPCIPAAGAAAPGQGAGGAGREPAAAAALALPATATAPAAARGCRRRRAAGG